MAVTIQSIYHLLYADSSNIIQLYVQFIRYIIELFIFFPFLKKKKINFFLSPKEPFPR